jgi:hypothetical protein
MSLLHQALGQGTLVCVPATGLVSAGPSGLETIFTFLLLSEFVATGLSCCAGQPRRVLEQTTDWWLTFELQDIQLCSFLCHS